MGTSGESRSPLRSPLRAATAGDGRTGLFTSPFRKSSCHCHPGPHQGPGSSPSRKATLRPAGTPTHPLLLPILPLSVLVVLGSLGLCSGRVEGEILQGKVKWDPGKGPFLPYKCNPPLSSTQSPIQPSPPPFDLGAYLCPHFTDVKPEASFWGEESLLELDRSHGCTTL